MEQTSIDNGMKYFDQSYGVKDLYNLLPSPFLIDKLNYNNLSHE